MERNRGGTVAVALNAGGTFPDRAQQGASTSGVLRSHVIARWAAEVARRPLLPTEQRALRIRRFVGEAGAAELAAAGVSVEPLGAQPLEVVVWETRVKDVRVVALLGTPAEYRSAGTAGTEGAEAGSRGLISYRILSGAVQLRREGAPLVEDAGAIGAVDMSRAFHAQTWGTFSVVMVLLSAPDEGSLARLTRERARILASVELGRALLVEGLSDDETYDRDARLMRELLFAPLSEHESSPLRDRALRLIEWEHTNPRTTVESIAAALGVSRRHLYRSFQGSGTTVGEALQRRRIATAVERLTTSPATLSEIARESGFASGDQFSRTFKRVQGVAPSEFRAASGQGSGSGGV